MRAQANATNPGSCRLASRTGCGVCGSGYASCSCTQSPGAPLGDGTTAPRAGGLAPPGGACGRYAPHSRVPGPPGRSPGSRSPSRHKCWRCPAVGAARTTTTLSRAASASCISVRLAALSATPNGAPRRSLRTCRLVPGLPRLVGSGPVAALPRGEGRTRTPTFLPLIC
jgi:hypothetical protein